MFGPAARCIPINAHLIKAMYMEGAADWRNDLPRVEAGLEESKPTQNLILLVIGLVLCHIGAVVSLHA